MSAKSDVIEYCKRCIHNFLRTISWWVWVEVIFKEVRSWKPSVVICYKAQMQYHVALWRCTASYESYRLTVRVWGDGKICLHAWSSFCKNHFMISFFFHWRKLLDIWGPVTEIFFYILWIVLVFFLSAICLSWWREHLYYYFIIDALVFLHRMKRQSDQLGFNCDLLLMLFLAVYLLLKINQC